MNEKSALFALAVACMLILAGCAGENGAGETAGLNGTANKSMNANFTNLANGTNSTAEPMNGTNASANSTNQTTAPNPDGEPEVVLDFLYADWCGHCAAMKPIVEELQASLPKERFVVRWWNEKYAQSSPEVGGVYRKYTQRGLFSAFPTFIINEEHPLVGSMPAPAFKKWVCGYFGNPKPQYCLAA